MLYIVTSFFFIQFILSLILLLGEKKLVSQKSKTENNGISIIVPFKNEADRILPLLNSFNQTKNWENIDLIFVDDHSTDNTVDEILNHLNTSYRIFRLRNTFGKKYAIKKGVYASNYSNILTLDADVEFSTEYIEAIQKIDVKDLVILPVKMKGRNFLQKLFSIEFDFLQRLTFGMAGLKNPVLCNGANLLFTKEIYQKAEKIRNDYTIKSGDDIYLLEAVKKLKGNIQVINENELVVKTPAPYTLVSLIEQRKRWILKMKNFASFMGALFLINSQVLFLFSLIYIWAEPLFLISIVLKITSEWLSIKKEKNQLFFILIHQFWYPIYMIFLFLSLPFHLKWRDSK